MPLLLAAGLTFATFPMKKSRYTVPETSVAKERKLRFAVSCLVPRVLSKISKKNAARENRELAVATLPAENPLNFN